MKARHILQLAACASMLALAACSGPRTYPLFPAERTAPPNVHYDVGHAYANGTGVARDYGKARSAYERAAEAGDARAMNNLGVMDLQGRGGAASPSSAIGWFRKAALAGSSAAHFNLGLLHELGIGGSVADAAFEYRIASAQGHALAQRRLAILLEGGHGLASGPDESRRLLQLSAVNGDPEALARVSAFRGTRLDASSAAAVLAEEGCVGCTLPEQKMASRAVGELHRLAHEGDASARYNLGVRHLTGNGAVRDPSEAARLFTLSARSGYAPAARQLAQMHLRGEAVGRSKVIAHAWLNLAARDGGAEGRAALSEMEALEGSMTPSEIEESQRLAAEFSAKGR